MKTIEGFLVSLGVLLVMLIALYGVSHLVIQFAPSPLNQWAGNIVQRSTPSGWSNS